MKRRIIHILSLLIILTFFHSCKRSKEEDAFELYLIYKGKHDSRQELHLFSKSELKFKAKFTNSAIYSTHDSLNQLDINKLYGFSDCNSPHHISSARFGWRWYQNRLEIFAYSYLEGIRFSKYITSVNLNQEYIYSIKLRDKEYIFYVNGVKVSMPRSCNNGGVKYHLYPYFGGDEKAPHDIFILIRDM